MKYLMVGLLFLVGCSENNPNRVKTIAIILNGKDIDRCSKILTTTSTFYSYNCEFNKEYGGGALIEHYNGTYTHILN